MRVLGGCIMLPGIMTGMVSVVNWVDVGRSGMSIPGICWVIAGRDSGGDGEEGAARGSGRWGESWNHLRGPEGDRGLIGSAGCCERKQGAGGARGSDSQDGEEGWAGAWMPGWLNGTGWYQR